MESNDPAMINPTVETNTLLIEKRLQSIEQKLAGFDGIFHALPTVCCKVDMCILDINVIVKSFSQKPQNFDQVIHWFLQTSIDFIAVCLTMRFSVNLSNSWTFMILLPVCVSVRLPSFLSKSPSLCSIISVFSMNPFISDWISRCLSLLYFSSFPFVSAIISDSIYLCCALLSIFRATSALFRRLVSY